MQSKGVTAVGSAPCVVAVEHASQLWRAMGCSHPDLAWERTWRTITLGSFLNSHRVGGSNRGYSCSVSKFRHSGNV